MNRLTGKIAVITGGSTGIGRATAKLFVEEGAYVYITGRRQSELDDAVKEIGHDITAVQGDVANLDDLDRLYETVKQKHGHLDILFANAGVGTIAPLGSITEEQYDREFGTNTKGTIFTVQKALPIFQDGGSIILNASLTASKPWPAMTSVYGGSKAAIRAFARSWASELLTRKIRVNAISAGTTDTAIIKPYPTEAENAPIREFLTSHVPMQRVAAPREIATAALFLASDDSSFITGIDLPVDGGAAQF